MLVLPCGAHSGILYGLHPLIHLARRIGVEHEGGMVPQLEARLRAGFQRLHARHLSTGPQSKSAALRAQPEANGAHSHVFKGHETQGLRVVRPSEIVEHGVRKDDIATIPRAAPTTALTAQQKLGQVGAAIDPAIPGNELGTRHLAVPRNAHRVCVHIEDDERVTEHVHRFGAEQASGFASTRHERCVQRLNTTVAMTLALGIALGEALNDAGYLLRFSGQAEDFVQIKRAEVEKPHESAQNRLRVRPAEVVADLVGRKPLAAKQPTGHVDGGELPPWELCSALPVHRNALCGRFDERADSRCRLPAELMRGPARDGWVDHACYEHPRAIWQIGGELGGALALRRPVPCPKARGRGKILSRQLALVYLTCRTLARREAGTAVPR
eukprot:scaffold148379_cov32-Tisochrysis_lutea.AAC.1